MFCIIFFSGLLAVSQGLFYDTIARGFAGFGLDENGRSISTMIPYNIEEPVMKILAELDNIPINHNVFKELGGLTALTSVLQPFGLENMAQEISDAFQETPITLEMINNTLTKLFGSSSRTHHPNLEETEEVIQKLKNEEHVTALKASLYSIPDHVLDRYSEFLPKIQDIARETSISEENVIKELYRIMKENESPTQEEILDSLNKFQEQFLEPYPTDGVTIPDDVLEKILQFYPQLQQLASQKGISRESVLKQVFEQLERWGTSSNPTPRDIENAIYDVEYPYWESVAK